MLERVPKYTLRKLSVGLASVMIGSGILMNSPKVLADTTNSDEGTSHVVQEDKNKISGAIQGQKTDSKADVQGSSDTPVAETATGNKNESENELELAKAPARASASATTINAEEKVVATNPQDTKQDKDKQTNANEATQNTTDVGKKDTEVTPTNEATTPATQNTTAKFKVWAVRLVKKAAATTETPTEIPASAKVPAPEPTTAYATSSDWSDLTKGKAIAYYTANDDTTTITGVYNKPDATSSDWLKLTNGKAIVYYTAKGKDGKTYVTGYVGEGGKSQSVFDVDQINPESLEYHLIYRQGDNKNNTGLWASFADGKTIEVDGGRIGSDGFKLKSEAGYSYNWSMNGVGDGGNYFSYADYLKNHNNSLEKATQISLTGTQVKAGDTIEMTIPVKYAGKLSDSQKSLSFQSIVDDYGNGFTRRSSTLYFTTVRKVKLHPEQIAPAPKPTTDDATTTTGVYNNPLVTSSDWIKMTHGDAIGYYTAKGKDGKTYVTGYAAPKGNSQSIFNVDQIDLNSLEFHLLYHNGDKEVNSGLWFNFADGKTLKLDTSRLGADGPQLKSQQGWSYKWSINTGADQGIYYNSWAEYLKAHNNVGDQASQISMTGVALKPDDTIEFNIPVKYTGQLSAGTPSLRFEQDIDDYGSGFARSSASLYFTTVKKDLSEVKQVVLLPAEFMGEQPGQSKWKPVEEISKYMPNVWEALKISNFPTYKGLFNMDSLPKGDLPSIVYGSAQYYIDLSKIQEIFANHGYTVKYANNNGKAQEMPFYVYSTQPGAVRVDGGKLGAPSIWVIQVQAVPAIILNKDQHYVANPNAKPWDTASMIDEIYAADDPGQRQTRDQLKKLSKTDVDISYEYQAPGAATAAAVDKVDLTKAGVYTVTYSHTYADGQVVKDSRKVYVDGVKPETKDITRTIIVHTPNGSDQKVIQTATLTRDVILDATTGEIKSLGEWSTTTNWERYSAPEFKGYTPDKDHIDATAVNKDTQDTTVEISYKANEITKPETKDVTRTIIVHTPKGTDQKVIQKATLTREVILYVPTGEIKSLGEWSTAKWETYSAPEFTGYTPDKAQIDETTVNKNTQDITVEISYTANTTQKQETKDITRTIIVHEPNGTDQTVIQKATLTREVTLYAPTGEIKSLGEWSTAKWETYSAPEFTGYTPDKAQIDETTVNKNTQDITVEISYTANTTQKQETKDITRTIIVHEPNGTDQTVIQKATLTRKVILYAPTGEIKSAGKWSTAKWERYSAPEFTGYTPDKAQIDETTVNEDTQNTTVEISYTANETSEQPGHSKDNNGGNNSNTELTDNNTDTSNPTDNNKSSKTKSTTTSKSNQSSKAKRTTKSGTISPKAVALASKSNQSSKAKRTTKSGTISPKAGALANTTAGPATSAKANMENGIAKNNSQNSQTLPQTGENESKVAFAVAGLLAAALGIFGIAINRKKEN